MNDRLSFRIGKFSRKKIGVSVVSSPEGLKQGLSGSQPIGSGNGMLFIFPKYKLQSMWMIDMLFPLDIVWLDTKLQVVHINKGCMPCINKYNCPKYSSLHNAKYAIEMEAGQADDLGFEVGKSLSLTSDYFVSTS